MVQFRNGDLNQTMSRVFIINNIIMCFFDCFRIPLIVTTMITLYYFSSSVYILFNNYRVVFKFFDLYYEVNYNKTIYFRHKCSCCDECNGVFEFSGKMNEFHKLVDDEIYIMGVKDCINDYNYVCEGKFDNIEKYFYNCYAYYSSHSIYKGTMLYGMPNGYGVLEIRKKIYNKKDTIKTIKKYGFWRGGKIDYTRKYEVKIYYDKENKSTSCNIAIYKNIELTEKEGISKCFIFYKKDRQITHAYYGEINNTFHKHGLGSVTFKMGCLKSFEGIFFNDNPLYGKVTFCSGITYTGFINNQYNLEGEGSVDKTNYNVDSTCNYALSFFEDECSEGSTDIIGGFFKQNELVYKITDNFPKSEHCMKNHPKKCECRYNSFCLNCEQLYCYACILKCHIKNHKIAINCLSKENIDLFEFYKEIFELEQEQKKEKELKKIIAKNDIILKLKLEEKKQIISVIKIQKWFRVCSFKKYVKYLIRLRASVKIQRFYRNYILCKKAKEEFISIYKEIVNSKTAKHRNIIFSKEKGIQFTKYNGNLAL